MAAGGAVCLQVWPRRPARPKWAVQCRREAAQCSSALTPCGRVDAAVRLSGVPECFRLSGHQGCVFPMLVVEFVECFAVVVASTPHCYSGRRLARLPVQEVPPPRDVTQHGQLSAAETAPKSAKHTLPQGPTAFRAWPHVQRPGPAFRHRVVKFK